MSSRSMNYLRKNAKVITVFMGVVCMITFVVGSALVDLANSAKQGAKSQNPVVVSWTKGNLHRDELYQLQHRHRMTLQFLYRVIGTTIDRGGTPMVNGRPITAEQVRAGQFFDVGIPASNSEESIVQTMVLAEEARKMGVAVDQDAVKQFLRQLSSPELKEGDWRDIATELVSSDKHITVGQLFEHLAYELKAQHVRMLAMAGLYAQGVGTIVPPGEAWELFNRLNRRMAIEAYPVDTEPLVSQVTGEPSAAEVQKLFDEGKYRDPDPNIDEPGFHKPHKLAFTALKVNFAPFLEEAKKQITEAQIEEAYQKDISQGLHKVQELPSTTPPGESKEGDKPVGDKPAGDKPASDKNPPEKPADANDAEKPAEKEAAPPAAEAKPATKTEANKPEGDKKAEGDKGGCATDDEPAAKAATEDKPAEKPAPEAKPDDKTVEAKPAAEAKPAEATKGADEKPAETPAATTEQKFKPLSEVREQILTRLAQPIAEEARKQAVGELTTAIEKYGKAYRRYQDVKNVKKSGDLKDPGKLDLAPLAVKYNFPISETPLVDQFEVAKEELGQKVQQFDMAAAQRGQFRMLSFADLAFGQDQPLYSPQDARSSEPDVSYIFFRTAEEKAADATLKEAKPQIVAYWKKQKAFELAKVDAQKLADKAKGAASLAEAVPDSAKLVTTAPFSWMTTGGFGFGQPELTTVPNLELPGEEFMQAVFALQPGEVGIAPNQSHGKVYVVRALSQDPDDERLRSLFLESGYNQMVLMLAQSDALRTSVEWWRGIADGYHVKWQRPPHDERSL